VRVCVCARVLCVQLTPLRYTQPPRTESSATLKHSLTNVQNEILSSVHRMTQYRLNNERTVARRGIGRARILNDPAKAMKRHEYVHVGRCSTVDWDHEKEWDIDLRHHETFETDLKELINIQRPGPQ